jgi:MFS family permease
MSPSLRDIERARFEGSVLLAATVGMVVGAMTGGTVAVLTRSVAWTTFAGAIGAVLASPVGALVGGDIGVLLEAGLDGYDRCVDLEQRDARARRWAAAIAAGTVSGALALPLFVTLVLGAVVIEVPRRLGVACARVLSHVGTWWVRRRSVTPEPPRVLGPFRTIATRLEPNDEPKREPAEPEPTRGERVLQHVGRALVFAVAAACVALEIWFWALALR